MRNERNRKIASDVMQLYALVSEEQCRYNWQDTICALLRGGVDMLQLREKALADAEILSRARWMRRTVGDHDALCIINDRPDIAILAEADGVHLGQDDLPIPEVRELAGGSLIIGRSTHSVEQARRAEAEGADYIAAGPVFATATKGYETGVGVELVQDIVAATTIPVVAIGGIGPSNLSRMTEAGVQAVAICSALCDADDPQTAAENMREHLRECKS